MLSLKGRRVDKLRRGSKKSKLSTLIITTIAILCFSVGIISSYKPLSFIQPVIPFVSGFLILIVPSAAQWFFSLISKQAESDKNPLTDTLTEPLVVPPSSIYVVPPASTVSLSTPQTQRSRNISGRPKSIESKTIQKRKQLVEEIYTKLVYTDGLTAIVLTGIADIGKTILASLIYHYAESQRYEGFGPFVAEPLWLQVDASTTIADLAQTIFASLNLSEPENYNNLLPETQAKELFNALNMTLTPILVILDDFDSLLDEQTGCIHIDSAQEAICEWIELINSQPCTCRFLFISRFQIKETKKSSPFFPDHMGVILVEGLKVVEGVKLLRKRKVRGKVEDLHSVVECCSGHPGALIQLASDLHFRKQNLSDLLVDPTYAQSWRASIIRGQFNPILKQLSQLQPVQRKLLLAFSIFREPVSLDIALEILAYFDTEMTDSEIMSALDTLLIQCVLRTTTEEGDQEQHFYPHAIIAEYVRDNFIENGQQVSFELRQAAHARAAQLYSQWAATRCDSRGRRQRSSNIHELVEAIWHQCRARRWQDAYNLMQQESIFAHINRWGNNSILLELYQRLLPLTELTTKHLQAACIYNNLGRICGDLGKKERAKEYYQKALNIYEEEKDSKGEGRALNNLGVMWNDLGDHRRAQENLKKALYTSKSVGDLEGVGRALNNLGAVYDSIGEQGQAQMHYEQALQIYKEVGDREGEGRTFNNLGVLSISRGETERALEYYKQALEVCEEVEDRDVRVVTLHNLGVLYFLRCHYQIALAFFELTKENIGD